MKNIILTIALLCGLNTVSASTVLSTGDRGYIYFDNLSLQNNPTNTDWTYIEVSYAEPLDLEDEFNINLYGSSTDATPFLTLIHTSDPPVFSFENSVNTIATSWSDLEGLIEIDILSGAITIDSIYISVPSNQDVYEGTFQVTAVPLPSAVWLFGSGVLGLIGIAKNRNS